MTASTWSILLHKDLDSKHQCHHLRHQHTVSLNGLRDDITVQPARVVARAVAPPLSLPPPRSPPRCASEYKIKGNALTLNKFPVSLYFLVQPRAAQVAPFLNMTDRNKVHAESNTHTPSDITPQSHPSTNDVNYLSWKIICFLS